MRKALTTITAGWLLVYSYDTSMGRIGVPVTAGNGSSGIYKSYEDCIAAGKKGFQGVVRLDGTSAADNINLRNTIIMCIPDSYERLQ